MRQVVHSFVTATVNVSPAVTVNITASPFRYGLPQIPNVCLPQTPVPMIWLIVLQRSFGRSLSGQVLRCT